MKMKNRQKKQIRIPRNRRIVVRTTAPRSEGKAQITYNLREFKWCIDDANDTTPPFAGVNLVHI